jgi:hypothetical protein
MSQEKIIEETLTRSLESLNAQLNALRESLSAMSASVPVIPAPKELAAAIAGALPEPEATPASAPPPLPAGQPAQNLLLFHVAAIEYADSQVEILKRLMAGVQEFASRGALYILKGDAAQSWAGFGFPEEVRGWKTSLDEDPLLKTMVQSRLRILLDNTLPAFIPAKGAVRRSMITPLLLKGKPAAFLYADADSAGKLDHYSVDILMRAASLSIDILPLRPKRDPLPAALENQDIILPGAPPAKPSAQEEEALFEDSGTLSAEPSETVVAEIPPAEPAPPEISFAPSQPQPPQAPLEEEPIPPGEEKAHEDAKRFARLLIQEIVLYHPKEVEDGRANKNLYVLLKDDIDRSREAYEQRFTKPSIRGRDYFKQAMIHYLADGDASLLGV